MSTTFPLDFVEAALLGLLKANMPAAYAQALPAGSAQIVGTGDAAVAAIDIDGLGEDDFDDDGQLVLNPPSIRVRFLGADYNTLHDNQRLTYQTAPNFELLCFESSLRSKADERKQTLILVKVLQDQLSGARINLSDGSKTQPVTIIAVRLVEGVGNGVDQLFSVLVAIEGFAQFSGVNANPN